jgi:pyruvate dehydrogenase complex dehydrogenase (E1) component
VSFLRAKADADAVRRGGYVLSEAAGGARKARAGLIATGSEVPLAVQAQGQLVQAGVPVRVVSIPSTTVFDRQDAACKAGVLPERLPRVAIEAGVTDFWWKYVRASGAALGVDRFGESAPAADVYRDFGLTVEKIVAINDLGDTKINAHLTRHDTAHGKFPGTVAIDGTRGSSTATASASCRTATRRSCRGRTSASTSCTSARVSSPPRKRPRRT